MTTCKTGAEHIKSLKDGRTVYIDGKLVADVTEHPAFRNSVKSAAIALRLPGEAGKHRADDVRARRLEPPRQPRLADAAQLRGDGAAAQGAAGLGRAVLRLHGPLARSPRLGAGRPADGHRGVPQSTARSAPRRCADYFEEASRNDYFLTYVIINPQAERAQGLGRAGRRTWSRASSTRIPAASPSAAPRCSAPARSWPTRCWSPTCSR